MASEQLKVGDTLYIYKFGRQWDSHLITGENKASWILIGGLKVDKATMRLRGNPAPQVFTAEQKQEEEWRMGSIPGIIRLVERADTATLRQIAALLGYERE